MKPEILKKLAEAHSILEAVTCENVIGEDFPAWEYNPVCTAEMKLAEILEDHKAELETLGELE